MRRYIPQILLVSVILAPLFLIGGVSFISQSTPLEGKTLSHVDFLKNSQNHFEVVFFGYVGCTYICPTSLITLGEVLDEVYDEYPRAEIGGFFVDVNAETQIMRAREYGLYFSSRIEGVNTNQEELNNLRKHFGLNVIDTNRGVDEIIHTDHFYILERVEDGWKIKRVLANQTQKESMKMAIKQVIIKHRDLVLTNKSSHNEYRKNIVKQAISRL